MSNIDLCKSTIELNGFIGVLSPNQTIKGTINLFVYGNFKILKLEAQLKGISHTMVSVSSEDSEEEDHCFAGERRTLVLNSMVKKGKYRYDFDISFPKIETSCHDYSSLAHECSDNQRCILRSYLPPTFSFSKMTAGHSVKVTYRIECYVSIMTNAGKKYSSRDFKELLFVNPEISKTFKEVHPVSSFGEKDLFIEKRIEAGNSLSQQDRKSSSGFFRKIFKKDEETGDVKHVLFKLQAEVKSQYYEMGGSFKELSLSIISSVGSEKYTSSNLGSIYISSIKVSLVSKMLFTAKNTPGTYNKSYDLTGSSFKSGFMNLSNLEKSGDEFLLVVPKEIFNPTKLNPIPEKLTSAINLCNYENKYELLIKIKIKGENSRSSKTQIGEICLSPIMVHEKGILQNVIPKITKAEEVKLEAKNNINGHDEQEQLPVYEP